MSRHTGVADAHLEATFNEVDEDSEEHPVAYVCSEQLKPRESYYSTTRCLVAIWASFDLSGQTSTIFTDNRPLAWLNGMKISNLCRKRRAEILQRFKAEVQNQPGSKCKNADGTVAKTPTSN